MCMLLFTGVYDASVTETPEGLARAVETNEIHFIWLII